jgi:hypothetical protein
MNIDGRIFDQPGNAAFRLQGCTLQGFFQRNGFVFTFSLSADPVQFAAGDYGASGAAQFFE